MLLFLNIGKYAPKCQKVVSVKLIENYDVTNLYSVLTSLLTINFILTTFCKFDAREKSSIRPKHPKRKHIQSTYTLPKNNKIQLRI